MDVDDAAVEERLEERRLRTAPPARVVARAIRAEEAQDRDLQAAFLGQRQHEVLVVELRDRVGPAPGGRRPEQQRPVLAEGRLGVPVHVGGGRDDQIGVHRERDLCDHLGAVHVLLQRGERTAVARDLLRRQVHDRVAAVQRCAHLASFRAVDHLEPERRVLDARLQVQQAAA